MKVLEAQGTKTLANVSASRVIDVPLRLARNDDGCTRGLEHRRTDRAQQHACEAPAAMAADDDQLGILRCFDELVSRLPAHDDAAHGHVGVALLPTRQTLGKDFFGFLL